MTTTTSEFTVGKLKATVRASFGKGVARKLRNKGLIPAVLYGKDQDAISLTLDPKALSGALDPAKKQNTLIELTVDQAGSSQQFTVMVKDYQVEALRHELLHADFVRVAMDQLVDVTVPLRLEGKPEGVKLGGTLHQVFRELPVSCIPAEIPAEIVADVTPMDLNATLQVKDLKVPAGARINLAATRTVALVMTPKKADLEEEAAPAEGAVEGETAPAEGEASAEKKA